MSDTLKTIFEVLGCIIVFIASGIVTQIIFDKIEFKRRRHDFAIMCYAVAADICLATRCNYTALLEVLERCLEISSNRPRPAGYITQDYDCAYANNDYLNFTHLVALKYAAENDMREDLRAAINEFCGKKYLTDRNILGCSTLDHISHYSEGKYRYYSKWEKGTGGSGFGLIGSMIGVFVYFFLLDFVFHLI